MRKKESRRGLCEGFLSIADGQQAARKWCSNAEAEIHGHLIKVDGCLWPSRRHLLVYNLNSSMR